MAFPTRTLRKSVLSFALGTLISAAPATAESLVSAVRSAVTNNPTAQAADADVRASLFEMLELKGEYQPEVTLFGEAGAEVVDNPATLSAADNADLKGTAQIGVGVEYLLYDGYRRENLVYRNATRLDAAILRQMDASETLALNAVESYIDILRLRSLVQLAAENIARHQDLGRQVDELVNGGRLPESDRFVVRDRIAAARDAKLNLDQSLANAEARYTRVIGHAPRGKMHVPSVKSVPRNLRAFQNEAVQKSFRVRVADKVARESRFDGNIKEADRQPRVTLNGGVTYGVNREGNSSNRSDAFVGVRMNWTLYNGRRPAQSAGIRERVREAELERRVAAEEVRELSARTWNAFLKNTKRSALLDEQLRANFMIVRQYRDELDAAKRTVLDLLEAERAVFNVKLQKISADAALSFSKYRMLAARSRLAEHFGVANANRLFAPDYEERALKAPRAAVFNTVVEPLR
ncbi:MAG: TolC family protein [Sulfitobacter sp.]|nr:TolC family protein [Sulfitobacter sp.]